MQPIINNTKDAPLNRASKNATDKIALNQMLDKYMTGVVLVAGLIFSAQYVFAKEGATTTQGIQTEKSSLLYISPNDYNYSVRLLHPYYDYWFEQGPLVEPIALLAFQTAGLNISMCKANETADQVIRVKPSLFYNPQLRVFHSRVIATLYSGSGEQLETYVGEAQQQGFMAVNHATKMHLNKAYAAAMEDLMEKIASGATTEVKAKVNTVNVYDAKILPCGFIGQQAEPRIGFY
jgi:hypothetical protein